MGNILWLGILGLNNERFLHKSFLYVLCFVVINREIIFCIGHTLNAWEWRSSIFFLFLFPGSISYSSRVKLATLPLYCAPYPSWKDYKNVKLGEDVMKRFLLTHYLILANHNSWPCNDRSSQIAGPLFVVFYLLPTRWKLASFSSSSQACFLRRVSVAVQSYKIMITI